MLQDCRKRTLMAIFDQIDVNQDGSLEQWELEAVLGNDREL